MGRSVPIVSAVLGTVVVALAVGQTRSGLADKTVGGQADGGQATGVSNSASATPPSPVEALDACVQQRFHTLTSFGMGRIPTVPQHVQTFEPSTEAEKQAVADLEKGGWTVGFYLGGRALLRMKLTQAEWGRADRYSFRRNVSQPLFITAPEQEATQSSPDSFQTTSAEPPLPAPWQLQEAGQRALLAADSGDIDKSTIGPWTVEARLVRANQPACLKCHAADHTQGVYTIQVPPLTTSQITTSRSPGALHFFPAAPRPTPSPLHIGDAVGVAFYVYRREPASVMTRLLQQRKAFKDQAKSAVAVQAQVARSTAMATARR